MAYEVQLRIELGIEGFYEMVNINVDPCACYVLQDTNAVIKEFWNVDGHVCLWNIKMDTVSTDAVPHLPLLNRRIESSN